MMLLRAYFFFLIMVLSVLVLACILRIKFPWLEVTISSFYFLKNWHSFLFIFSSILNCLAQTYIWNKCKSISSTKIKMDVISRMLGWNMNTNAFTMLLCYLSYTVMSLVCGSVIGDNGRLISEFFLCSPRTKPTMNACWEWKQYAPYVQSSLHGKLY